MRSIMFIEEKSVENRIAQRASELRKNKNLSVMVNWSIVNAWVNVYEYPLFCILTSQYLLEFVYSSLKSLSKLRRY